MSVDINNICTQNPADEMNLYKMPADKMPVDKMTCCHKKVPPFLTKGDWKSKIKKIKWKKKKKRLFMAILYYLRMAGFKGLVSSSKVHVFEV